MERPLLPLLCGAVALLLPCAAAAAARCSRPRPVPNARVEAADATALDGHLRYACEPGYKRRAGTSGLTRCRLPPGAAEPAWSQPTLQCIRDPALPPLAPSPEPAAGGPPAPAGASAEPAAPAQPAVSAPALAVAVGKRRGAARSGARRLTGKLAL
ncbi:interleukin-15 receptor subunit alpha [Rhea pennata]|uniref:interleukin-15 receptor subunit alpha n=1 Tax=Rhea pennata TaxID=8795 RepID=UPI002E25384D